MIITIDSSLEILPQAAFTGIRGRCRGGGGGLDSICDGNFWLFSWIAKQNMHGQMDYINSMRAVCSSISTRAI